MMVGHKHRKVDKTHDASDAEGLDDCDDGSESDSRSARDGDDIGADIGDDIRRVPLAHPHDDVSNDLGGRKVGRRNKRYAVDVIIAVDVHRRGQQQGQGVHARGLHCIKIMNSMLNLKNARHA